MKNNKLSRLLEPSLGLYLACLVLFALASALFSVPLAVIEGVVVVILYLRRSNSIRKREMLRYIESVTANMDVATRDTMINSPLPMVIFHPDTDEIIWSNERFLQLTDGKEHLRPGARLRHPVAPGGQERLPRRGGVGRPAVFGLRLPGPL